MRQTKYSPLGNNLLVTPDTTPERSEGGIIFPEVSKKNLNTGTVFKCGPAVDPTEIQVGDHVMWDLNSDYKLKLDEDQWICVDAANILLIAKGIEPTHKYVPANPESRVIKLDSPR